MSFRDRVDELLWDSGKIKYMLVVVVGLMLVVLCVALTENGPASDGEEDEWEYYDEEDYPVFPVTSSAGEEDEEDEEETEFTLTISEEEHAGKAVMEGVTVISSVYQDAPGYDWQSLYTLLLDIAATSPDAENGEPVFFLWTTEESEEPLLLCGVQGASAETTKLYLYAADGERLYQLNIFSEVPQYDPAGGCLVFSGEKAMYEYSPHVLIRTELSSLPSGLQSMALVRINDVMVTSETIGYYLVDLSGEESGE